MSAIIGFIIWFIGYQLLRFVGTIALVTYCILTVVGLVLS